MQSWKCSRKSSLINYFFLGIRRMIETLIYIHFLHHVARFTCFSAYKLILTYLILWLEA